MMIRRTLLLSAIAFGASLSMMTPAATAKDKETPPAGKLLRHVVLFKFKADVSPAQIQEVVDAFGKLPQKIDGIEAFEWGTNVSPENKAAGFTHCFFVTFGTAASRDAYLPHPAHQEFVKLVGPRLDNVLVVDYWTEK
jgi:Stress responsive A/B Barrel Domain